MTYYRVIPRDLFNEAKLLKCLGFVSLGILDNKHGLANFLEIEHDGDVFEVCQWQHDASLYCSNLTLRFKSGEKIDLFSVYNSKASFPLLYQIMSETEYVFTSRGKFSAKFLKAIRENIKKK